MKEREIEKEGSQGRGVLFRRIGFFLTRTWTCRVAVSRSGKTRSASTTRPGPCRTRPIHVWHVSGTCLAGVRVRHVPDTDIAWVWPVSCLIAKKKNNLDHRWLTLTRVQDHIVNDLYKLNLAWVWAWFIKGLISWKWAWFFKSVHFLFLLAMVVCLGN